VTGKVQTKAAVSVAEMARMVGLSRARFYQLIGDGVFPAPSRQPDTGRPFYDEATQRACLEVRQRNFGANGRPVLFYARRLPTAPTAKPARQVKAATDTSELAEVLDGVKALGLLAATLAAVRAAVTEEYPNGPDGVDRGEVIRAVFLKLKCQNPADSVGR
jgi:hypothetical protein